MGRLGKGKALDIYVLVIVFFIDEDNDSLWGG